MSETQAALVERLRGIAALMAERQMVPTVAIHAMREAAEALTIAPLAPAEPTALVERLYAAIRLEVIGRDPRVVMERLAEGLAAVVPGYCGKPAVEAPPSPGDCTGPFSDARDCPVHSPRLSTIRVEVEVNADLACELCGAFYDSRWTCRCTA